MSRPFAVLSALAAVAASPVPKVLLVPGSYHPTKPGTRWVYRTGKVEYA